MNLFSTRFLLSKIIYIFVLLNIHIFLIVMMQSKSSEQTIHIANDVMNAMKHWYDEKHDWFVEVDHAKASDKPYNVPISSISVIRCKAEVVIGITYRAGRMDSKFYRMLNKSLTKWLNDKVARAILRKYNVSTTFNNIDNHSPNPELDTTVQTKLNACSIDELIASKSVVLWN